MGVQCWTILNLCYHGSRCFEHTTNFEFLYSTYITLFLKKLSRCFPVHAALWSKLLHFLGFQGASWLVLQGAAGATNSAARCSLYATHEWGASSTAHVAGSDTIRKPVFSAAVTCAVEVASRLCYTCKLHLPALLFASAALGQQNSLQ